MQETKLFIASFFFLLEMFNNCVNKKLLLTGRFFFLKKKICCQTVMWLLNVGSIFVVDIPDFCAFVTTTLLYKYCNYETNLKP